MATAPQSRRLNLTRDQLAEFLTDQQQIRQFELLFSTVDTLQVIVGTDFEYQADTAAATANEALAQISALAQDTSVDDAVLNAKVQQALDAIPGLEQALELLALAPRQELGTIASQNSDNVNITGGLISGLDAPLPVASGGIGVTTAPANQVFAGPTAGAAAAPAFRALVVADIPALPYGTGDVVGPASATDNAVARFNLTTGKLIQNSLVIVDDTGSVTGVNSLTAESLTVNNNATFGTSNSDTINFVGRINSDFDPATDNTYDLGRVGHEWRDLYIDGTANIDSLIADTADINGGTIDNTTIGATTPQNGSFVNLSVTGTTSFDGAQGTSGQVLTSAGTGNTPTWTTPTTGTVTAVSVVSANGLAGTVATATTTPAITMSTSITGLLYGNGTALAATTVSAPLAYSAGTLSITQSGTASNGYLSSTDWNTFNNKQSVSAPVTKTADFTVAATELWLINNKSGSSCTVTLPTPSTNSGRVLYFQNYQAQTLVSASSNVVPLAGGAAGTSILLASSGDSATLVSDGTNWLMTQYIPNNILLLE